MKAELIIKCVQCEEKIGIVKVDTADFAGQLQLKVNQIILKHRVDCKHEPEGVENE
jgi:hypothetical protein